MTFIDIAKDEPQRHRDTERAQSRVSSQPRRHKDTKTSQSSLDRPARSRPPGGQGPLGAGAASDASARSCTHSQRPALSESAGLASRVDQSSAFEQVRMRRDRRARRVGRGEDVRPRRMLASGTVGLFTGCRRSSDRRRCRRSTPGNLVDAGAAPLCSLCLRGCDGVRLCALCVSVVHPVRC